MRIEDPTYYGVPDYGMERPELEYRFHFRYLSGDRVEVHHPFHGVETVGNRSVFPDPVIDDAIAIAFQELPYLVDAMKLSRPRPYETRPYAGEYAQLSHCYSLAVIGRELGGGPLDILYAKYNDASHTEGGHEDDDLVQGHGRETFHDISRGSFFERSGLLKRFIDEGIFVGPHRYLRGTRLICHDFLGELSMEARRSFLSNNHPARRMDGDRFQYNQEESMLNALATSPRDEFSRRSVEFFSQQTLDMMARKPVPDDGEGEQLVFVNSKVAFRSTVNYVRNNSEHWVEPMQDLVSDLLILAKKYFFVCDHPTARLFQDHFPHDYLHTSSHLMYTLFEEVANDDPGMRWILDTAKSLAEHQRNIMGKYDPDAGLPYLGPRSPGNVLLRKLPDDETLNSSSAQVEGRRLRMLLPKGKVRTIDPRVMLDEGRTIPVSKLFGPDYEELLHVQNHWIGDYYAEIETEDSETAQAVGRLVDMVNARWQRALSRRPMSPTEFQNNIQEANRYVKKVAAFTLRSSAV